MSVEILIGVIIVLAIPQLAFTLKNDDAPNPLALAFMVGNGLILLILSAIIVFAY